MSSHEYRVTFGQRYARETHPTFGEAHPDGWLTIVAPNWDTAQRVAVGLLGREWACLYGPDDGCDWTLLFPRGELHRIEVET